MNLYAQYPATWFHFGGKGANWVLCYPKINGFDCLIWAIDIWNHVCFSYSKSNSFMSFVKVRATIYRYSSKYNISLEKSVFPSSKKNDNHKF